MINCFLLNEAIADTDYTLFLDGMSELLVINLESDDQFIKHNSVYELRVFETLYSTYGQSEQAIIKFMEQMRNSEVYLSDDEIFAVEYPNKLNGFLGIDFAKTGILDKKRIKDQHGFSAFKRYSYLNLRLNGDDVLGVKVLKYLYPNYRFDGQAIDDIVYWNHENFELYQRLHELLLDISANPFIGGIGKTEALKSGNGLASKRLDQEHRIIYSLKTDIVTVSSCRGHYE